MVLDCGQGAERLWSATARNTQYFELGMLVFCFPRREAPLVSCNENCAAVRVCRCWFFVSGFAAGRTPRPPSGRACFRRAGGAANSPLRSSFFSNTSHPPSLPYNKMYFLPDFNRFPTVYISHHFCMTVQAVYFPEKPANLGTIHLGIPENTSHPAYHSLSELHFPCILYGS